MHVQGSKYGQHKTPPKCEDATKAAGTGRAIQPGTTTAEQAQTKKAAAVSSRTAKATAGTPAVAAKPKLSRAAAVAMVEDYYLAADAADAAAHKASLSYHIMKPAREAAKLARKEAMAAEAAARAEASRVEEAKREAEQAIAQQQMAAMWQVADAAAEQAAAAEWLRLPEVQTLLQQFASQRAAELIAAAAAAAAADAEAHEQQLQVDEADEKFDFDIGVRHCCSSHGNRSLEYLNLQTHSMNLQQNTFTFHPPSLC